MCTLEYELVFHVSCHNPDEQGQAEYTGINPSPLLERGERLIHPPSVPSKPHRRDLQGVTGTGLRGVGPGTRWHRGRGPGIWMEDPARLREF